MVSYIAQLANTIWLVLRHQNLLQWDNCIDFQNNSPRLSTGDYVNKHEQGLVRWMSRLEHLPYKLDDLSSMPRTYVTVEGKTNSQKLPSDSRMND